VGEFAHGTAAGSSMSMWCYRVGPEVLCYRPRAENGKHPFYVLTLQPSADLEQLLLQVDDIEWDKPLG